MAARAIGTAAISFGLVSIPVKLYPSGESSRAISFRMLEKKTGSRLKQQYISAKTGEIVPPDARVKGYEIAKGQFVTFTKEELKAIEARSTQTIDIQEFVPNKSIDPIFRDKTYYLGPELAGTRAYQLLAEAMRQTNMIAIAKYAARGKDYLVTVRPRENGMVMEQLKYHDEIRSMNEVPIETLDLKDEEVRLAIQLIEQVASDQFQPDQYEDTVRKQIVELIDRKVAGEDITQEPEEEAESKIVDIMDALKASIEAAGGQSKPAKRAPKRKTAKKTRATRKKKASARK